jgi:hypothetical protein
MMTPKSLHRGEGCLNPFAFLALVLALVAITPGAEAVRIPFQNCLDESYRFNDPPRLQWVPLYADAVFDVDNDSHNLRVTVWGNVKGSQNAEPLPSPDDPYWKNDNETLGKIVETADPGVEGNKATTLVRKVRVLTYQPWMDAVKFCTEGLVGYSCPLSPVFNPASVYVLLLSPSRPEW